MSTMQTLSWAFELVECDPLQRLAAIYFANSCGIVDDKTVNGVVSISAFAAWAGVDSELAEAAIASLDDFEGVECYRDQHSGFDIRLSFVGDRTPVRASRDALLRSEPHWLYVIKTSTAVKVGISRNPENRMKGFRTAIPDQFEVILLGRGARSLVVAAESACHQALADYRITGEWFNCHPAEALRVAREVMAKLDIKEMPTK